ncbi:MAG: hypothetical protein AABW56_00875 [Nanoarchaeota archaeon]
MKSQVYFADEKIKKAYLKLKDSKTEDLMLYKWVSRAIDDLEKDAFCGISVSKHLIPKIYLQKYNIDNLWKYDLPKGWRLLYSISKNKVQIISIIIEWMNHKNYERRFGY